MVTKETMVLPWDYSKPGLDSISRYPISSGLSSAWTQSTMLPTVVGYLINLVSNNPVYFSTYSSVEPTGLISLVGHTTKGYAYCPLWILAYPNGFLDLAACLLSLSACWFRLTASTLVPSIPSCLPSLLLPSDEELDGLLACLGTLTIGIPFRSQPTWWIFVRPAWQLSYWETTTITSDIGLGHRSWTTTLNPSEIGLSHFNSGRRILLYVHSRGEFWKQEWANETMIPENLSQSSYSLNPFHGRMDLTLASK